MDNERYPLHCSTSDYCFSGVAVLNIVLSGCIFLTYRNHWFTIIYFLQLYQSPCVSQRTLSTESIVKSASSFPHAQNPLAAVLRNVIVDLPNLFWPRGFSQYDPAVVKHAQSNASCVSSSVEIFIPTSPLSLQESSHLQIHVFHLFSPFDAFQVSHKQRFLNSLKVPFTPLLHPRLIQLSATSQSHNDHHYIHVYPRAGVNSHDFCSIDLICPLLQSRSTAFL